MPAGRPSKYKPEFVAQAEKLCKLGATDAEIADFFEIDIRTLYRWKGEYEAFCHALKVGKVEADERIERSLFSRAIGYEHEEVDIRVIDNTHLEVDTCEVWSDTTYRLSDNEPVDSTDPTLIPQTITIQEQSSNWFITSVQFYDAPAFCSQ